MLRLLCLMNAQIVRLEGATARDNELLRTMNARMERLEEATARDNALLRELSFNIDRGLPRLLDISQSLRDAMDDLKGSLKIFTRGILDQVLGWHVEGDLEAEESV